MTIARRIHNLLHPKQGCVVMLHSVTEQVSEEGRLRHLEITPEALDDLVQSYQHRGWQFVSMDEVGKVLRESHHTPFVCLTFDDGYLDTYAVVNPMLSRLGVPFCVYMTRDFYHGTKKPNWNGNVQMMNVKQMLQMSRDPLCTIGAHTCSHPRLSGLSAEEQRREMKECKDDLEQLLGKEVKHMAYPYGDYNQDTVKIATELGFATAVTTSGRFVRSDSQLMELDRLVTF